MAVLGFGGSVTCGTSGFTAVLRNMRREGPARDAEDKTSLSSGPIGATTQYYTEAMGGSIDAGAIVAEAYADPDAQVAPPINGTNEDITFTWPKQTGESTAAKTECKSATNGSGFLESYGIAISNGILIWRLRWKLSGIAVDTAGS